MQVLAIIVNREKTEFYKALIAIRRISLLDAGFLPVEIQVHAPINYACMVHLRRMFISYYINMDMV